VFHENGIDIFNGGFDIGAAAWENILEFILNGLDRGGVNAKLFTNDEAVVIKHADGDINGNVEAINEAEDIENDILGVRQRALPIAAGGAHGTGKVNTEDKMPNEIGNFSLRRF